MNAAVLDAKRYRLALAGTIVPAAEWQTASEAQALIDRANAALAEAHAAAQEERRSAHAQGFAQGHQAALDSFAQALQSLIDARAALTAALHARAAQLAIAVVERIAPTLGAQQLLPALVEEAAQQLIGEPALFVRVHPDVADAVRARIAALGKGAAPAVDILGDPALAAFDCVIETQGGVVRAGLREQLDLVGTILAAALQEQEHAAEPAP